MYVGSLDLLWNLFFVVVVIVAQKNFAYSSSLRDKRDLGASWPILSYILYIYTYIYSALNVHFTFSRFRYSLNQRFNSKIFF